MEKVKCFAHFYADDGTNGDNKYYLVDDADVSKPVSDTVVTTTSGSNINEFFTLSNLIGHNLKY